MHARLLTFSQLRDVDRALVFLHETALSGPEEAVRVPRRLGGVDRKGSVTTVLSLWANESALESSYRPLLDAREQAIALSGASLNVEHFEQVSELVAQAAGRRQLGDVDPFPRRARFPE